MSKIIKAVYKYNESSGRLHTRVHSNFVMNYGRAYLTHEQFNILFPEEENLYEYYVVIGIEPTDDFGKFVFYLQEENRED